MSSWRWLRPEPTEKTATGPLSLLPPGNRPRAVPFRISVGRVFFHFPAPGAGCGGRALGQRRRGRGGLHRSLCAARLKAVSHAKDSFDIRVPVMVQAFAQSADVNIQSAGTRFLVVTP